MHQDKHSWNWTFSETINPSLGNSYHHLVVLGPWGPSPGRQDVLKRCWRPSHRASGPLRGSSTFPAEKTPPFWEPQAFRYLRLCSPDFFWDNMKIANYYTAVTCPTTAETLAKTGCNWPLAILRVTRHELFQIRPCLQRRSRLREKLLLSDLKEISGQPGDFNLVISCHFWLVSVTRPASIIWMVSVFAFSTSRLVKVPDSGNQMCMRRLFRTLVF